ncbi:hypothetical protein J8N05_35090 [Streptomyces sp. BH-SS-21]|uniref:Uncharacterized protein n=1 Tax=Streptomyces liliiviolaceus TaxID=2823109 RepID=A0A941BH32_9ACTN|nr:hypothetical protein [Streptomyces liliiviolaceus]MBQ0853394.1 hypothetical protein [Streptomyces liliiviolaceus]
MAADWWARGIALGAGLATTVNAAITLKNYRRARPRMIVQCKYRTMGNEIDLTVTLKNEGATPLYLEQVGIVVVELSTSPPRKRGYRWHRRSCEPTIAPWSISIDLEKRHAKVLHAFNAIEWYFRIPIDRELYDWFREMDDDGRKTYMRVRVPLPHLPITAMLTSNVMEGPDIWLLNLARTDPDDENELPPGKDPWL